MTATGLIAELQRWVGVHGDLPVIAGATLDTMNTENNVDFWPVTGVVVAEDEDGKKDIYLIGAMK